MNADLHCHSNVSDGLLNPRALVQRAHENGVTLLALTDHDELAGLSEARAAAEEFGVRFLDGVEISVSWGNDQTIHVVGLGVDPDYAVLDTGLAQLRGGRDARARRMAQALAEAGIAGAYEGALRYAGNPALVGRSHFARYIVEAGHAPDVRSVFDHWLARGKPGYVPHQWTTLATAVQWIHEAGGLAVIAHPGRYRVTKAELRRLLGEFRDLGGDGIEVLSGSHSADEMQAAARHAREFGLLASRGSDFHGPGESRVDLGRLPALPEGVEPIWKRLIRD
ncbi:MAG: PHP domain-containing protein [Sterolibacterium sp.]|nr:PHP domain-containing protein [Sterolibacterium sp.]MBP9798589.1 PHP domain-containing protein [Sterolibacterium sp.]